MSLRLKLSHLSDQANLVTSRELFIQFGRQYEEKDLKRLLTARYGPVESVDFNNVKLFAFVRFVSLQDALTAKEELPRFCKKVDFSLRRVNEGGGFYAILDMTGSKILVGFIRDNAIYCKNIILMPVNYAASVEFNGNRRLLQVFYGPYKYEFQWSHIKNIYWSEEESRLSIEWDHQIGGPKIICTSRNERTTENPLGLNEVDRNVISFIVNESEYKKHVKKIQGAFPIVTDRMKLAPVPPRDFVFPADIPLATGFLVERLLSMFIPKEVIDNNFWEVVRSTPTNLLHAALTNIYETSNSLVINPVTELKEQIAKAEKRMSNSKGVPADADVVPRDSVKMFYLDITPTKHYFHGPLIEKSNRVLRKYKDHPYNFMRVTFVEEDGTKLHNISNPLLEHFKQIMTNGVKLAGRHFKFLSWSNSQLKSHSCFFFASISRPQNEVSCFSIIQDLGKFKDGSPAKCAARIAQCFSTTSSGIPLTEDQYSFISDIQRNQYTFSDGIGKISPMLAKQVAKKHHLKPMPSAYQIRFKGCKGMVVVDPKLDGSKVELRQSMDKFISQDNELEINKHSTYHAAYLNRQIITLLLSLGADPKGFEALEAKMVAEIDAMFELNSETKEKVAMLNSFTSGYSGSLLKRITPVFGFDDAFVRALINVHCRKALNMLIEKTKIHVPKGAFLYGVLDEYGVLEENEIFVQIRDTNTYAKEVIEGLAIVTRSPCLHPGDIRHVKAVNKPELMHLENVVVFSQKGSRPITDMMAGGDLDGDFFTVLWDESIFPPRIAQPMSYIQSRQTVTSSTVLYPTDFIDFFIQHMANDTLGRIANLWLAHAERNKDEAAFSSACLTLAGLHSDAVDYAKTGIPVRLPEGLILKQFPDYMEKPDKDSFKSTTFIGESYRRIKQKFGSKREEPNVSLVADTDLVAYPGYNEYLNEAYKIMKAYNRQIDQLKRIYGTFSEVEIVSGIILRSKKARNRRQNNAIENLASNYAVIRSEFLALFKQGTEKDKKSKLAKASAWYRAVYMPSENYKGKRKQYASFAWLVDKYLIKIKQEAVQRRKVLGELMIKDANNDSGPATVTRVTNNSIQSTTATRTALSSNNTNVQPSPRNVNNSALSYRAKPQQSLAVTPSAGKVQSTGQQPKYVVFGRYNNKN